MINPEEKEELREHPQELIKMMRYLKTEIAFTKMKHSEVVERKVKEAKLDLGAEKIDIDVRVKLMEDACSDLRQNRYFLKALELKE